MIVVFSDDTLCQNRNSRRRHAISKTLEHSKLPKSVPYNNNNRNVESKKSWPFNLVKTTNQRKFPLKRFRFVYACQNFVEKVCLSFNLTII